MSAATHTPGPWSVKQFGGVQIVGPQGYAVAAMWGALNLDAMEEQDAANARLIAAAPELLAALIALSGNIGAASLARNKHGQMLRANAEAAIAKATGQ